MRASRILPILIPGLELFTLCVIGFVIRVLLPYSNVFTANGIAFTGNDAYYHMRLVQGLVNNFPHFPAVDPYLLFGMPYELLPSLFQWVLGVIAWIAGLGTPSQHLLDVLGAYFPAVLGALTVIPAYFIGKELWGKHGRWAGIIAGALVALLPGEFLGRSILGFTDQHVMETLLSTTAILFLIMAVKSARIRDITLLDFKSRKWEKVLRPSIYAILSGLFLGLYIFSWQGALLVVFAVALFFVVQFIIEHIRQRNSDYLLALGIIVFLVSFISLVFIPIKLQPLLPPSLVIGLLIPAVLWVLSRILNRYRLNRFLYPLCIVVGGLAGLGLFYLINPSLVKSMLAAFNIFTPSETLRATIEAQSILTPFSGRSGILNTPAWTNFYFTLPVGFIGLLIILVQCFTKQGTAEKVAFIVWTAVMVIATIGQRRFAYYAVVNMALLSGYVSILFYYLITWLLAYTGGDRTLRLGKSIFNLDGLTEYIRPAVTATLKATTKKARRRAQQLARKHELDRRRMSANQTNKVKLVRNVVSIAVSVIVIFMLLFSPVILFPDEAHGMNSPPAIATAKTTPYAPESVWMKTLAWMKDNTPEPFGSAEAYFAHYKKGFIYPDSAYGVLAWWDYGYWITYIGHRIPNANPGQDPVAVKWVANFLVAQDEITGDNLANEMKSAYVIIDYQTATSKFWAVATWAGQSQSDYFEIFWDVQSNQQRLFIYPAYYQAMSTRLFSFNGTAQEGINPLVVEYVERTSKGMTYKEVVNTKQFATYDEAVDFVSNQASGNFKIVGTSIAESPVPLAALENYRLVHSSEETIPISSSAQTAQIKIFERVNRQ